MLLQLSSAISELVSIPLVRRTWSCFMVLLVLGTINAITGMGVFYIYPDFLGGTSGWGTCFAE